MAVLSILSEGLSHAVDRFTREAHDSADLAISPVATRPLRGGARRFIAARDM
jgi:hypothetical protein